MFLELGPDNASVPAYGNSVFLPSLSELWEFQAGYRYHGLTGEDLADWPDELLVVGHQGGDPIAIDRTLGTVYFARHGSGLWRFESLSDSLAAAVIGIGVLGSIVHEAGPDLCDDDSIVRSEHVDDAVERLSKLMGTDNAHQMLRWAEWML